MSLKYPGGFITKSPVAPTGPFETSVAKGVWTLDQAMQLKKQGLWPTAGNIAPPTVIGQAYGGGFYAGQIGVSSVATHYLVVGPLSTAQSTNKQWKTTNTTTAGTSSNIDGPANSLAMNSANHPAAFFCEGLSIGGYTDWYMPAKNELDVCYYNLKPTNASNTVLNGINANSVPERTSAYTSGTPAQTSAVDFIVSAPEAFSDVNYWSSTENSYNGAWRQRFSDGRQAVVLKYGYYYVRAIRRVAV